MKCKKCKEREAKVKGMCRKCYDKSRYDPIKEDLRKLRKKIKEQILKRIIENPREILDRSDDKWKENVSTVVKQK